MFNLQSPDGHSAWDYAQTIVTLLHGLREDVQSGRGDNPVSRRLSFAGISGATSYTATFPIPLGKRWELAGFAAQFGAATGDIAFYVNEVAPNNLIYTQPLDGVNTRISSNFGSDGPEVFKEDLNLIVVLTIGAAIAVGGTVRVLEYDGNPNDPKQVIG